MDSTQGSIIIPTKALERLLDYLVDRILDNMNEEGRSRIFM
jgi:hypothetical protein